MVKEIDTKAYQCEKCSRRSFGKYDISEHEKNCGIGVKVGPDDIIVESRGGGDYSLHRVTAVSGKSIFAHAIDSAGQKPRFANPREFVQGGSRLGLYDASVLKEVDGLIADAKLLEAQEDEKREKARELVYSLKPAWA